MSQEMVSLGAALDQIWGRLGLAPIWVLQEISDQWDQLAESPWAQNSTPLVIRHRELIVEAHHPSMVRILTYSVDSLRSRLEQHFGPGVVEKIKVQAPADGGRYPRSSK